MKSNLRCVAMVGSIMTCVLAVGSTTARADIIPPNSHYVSRCVLVTNANDYPEYSLVSLVVSIVGGPNVVRVIDRDPSACMIGRGYKFNSFDLFAVRTDHLQRYRSVATEHGSLLQDVPVRRNGNGWTIDDRAFSPVSVRINPDGGYVDNSNPVVSVTTICNMVANRNRGDLIIVEEREDRSGSFPSSPW